MAELGRIQIAVSETQGDLLLEFAKSTATPRHDRTA